MKLYLKSLLQLLTQSPLLSKIEKHVAKMLSKNAVIGASNTNKKAFVAGLYKRIGACSESGFFDNDNFTIKHSK